MGLCWVRRVCIALAFFGPVVDWRGDFVLRRNEVDVFGVGCAGRCAGRWAGCKMRDGSVHGGNLGWRASCPCGPFSDGDWIFGKGIRM